MDEFGERYVNLIEDLDQAGIKVGKSQQGLELFQCGWLGPVSNWCHHVVTVSGGQPGQSGHGQLPMRNESKYHPDI